MYACICDTKNVHTHTHHSHGRDIGFDNIFAASYHNAISLPVLGNLAKAGK